MLLDEVGRVQAQPLAPGHLAHAAGDLKAARRVGTDIRSLYARRPDMSWALSRLEERQGEVMDADGLLNLTETELMAPLDRAALGRQADQLGLFVEGFP